MGTVAGRLCAIVAALVLVVPGSSGATPTNYPAPYDQGPQGGDTANHFMVDGQTGQMTILRLQAFGVTGGLGCGGSGGFSYFKVSHNTPGVTTVTASFTDAIVDPYTFVHVAVRQGGSFLNSKALQGPIVSGVTGADSVTVDLGSASTGAIEVWFGLQVTSACPNVDGGTVRFTSVTVA